MPQSYGFGRWRGEPTPAAPMFNPDDIDNLYTWYDISQEVGPYTNYNMTVWNNLSSAGDTFDATITPYGTGQEPHYAAGYRNGLHAALMWIEFPGEANPQKVICPPASVAGGLFGASGFTIAIAMESWNESNVTQALYQLAVYSTTVKISLRLNGTGNNVQFYSRSKKTDSALLVTSATAIGTGWNLIIADVDLPTATANIWLNDSDVKDATHTDTGLGFSTTFSNETSTSLTYHSMGYLYGYIGEIAAYNRVLTTAERTGLRNYFLDKWNIT